jgi:hypothetical protein
VDTNKDLFYCYGCGRGGDVIRFAELYHQVKFSEALALLRQWRGVEHSLLHEAARFYGIQLHRHSEAFAYLYQRGVRSWTTIELMRIGYAPGGCLRGWLTQLGHSLPALRQAGLVLGVGYDAYGRRIVFPLEDNLYGRSLSADAPPHRFLPGAKGGLYAWTQVRQAEHLIHWTGRKGGTVATLDERMIEEFVRHLNRCRCPRYGRTNRRDIRKGAALFLRYARFADVVTTRGVREVIVDPVLLVAFHGWMRQQRGTCDATLYNYSLHLRDLLKSLGEDPARLMLTSCGNLSWILVNGADGQQRKHAPRQSACSCVF